MFLTFKTCSFAYCYDHTLVYFTKKHLKSILNTLIPCRYLRPCVAWQKHDANTCTQTHGRQWISLSSASKGITQCQQGSEVNQLLHWWEPEQSAVCSWSCKTVRSHRVAVSQTWSHCTVMWIRSQVSEIWIRMHVAQQSRITTCGYSGSQRPKVRGQQSLKHYEEFHFYYGS